jgi:hypothetical protein
MRARLLLLLVLTACAKRPEAPTLAAFPIEGGLTIDGELEEAPWVHTPSSGALPSVTDGKLISPHTELRALWSDDALFLAIYAADQDLRSSDTVHVRVGKLDFTIAASGLLNGAPFDVQAGVERDGTLDVDAAEDDEEWTAELASPWSALGLKTRPESLALAVWREDTPKHAAPRTVSWARTCDGKPASGTLTFRRRAVASP